MDDFVNFHHIFYAIYHNEMIGISPIIILT